MKPSLFVVFACAIVAALVAFSTQFHPTRQSTTVPQPFEPSLTETPVATAVPTQDLLAEPRAAVINASLSVNASGKPGNVTNKDVDALSSLGSVLFNLDAALNR